MPKSSGLLIGVAISLSAVLCAQAQKFQPKAIQFVGAPEYSTQELLDASGLKKGAVLNYAEMNDCSKQLMDTGMFAALAFKFDGQDLVFTVTPSDNLLAARFDNLPLGSPAEIDEQLHKQFPLYRGKVPSEGGYTESVRAALEQILAAHGLQATVTAVPTGDPTHRGPATIESFSITTPKVLAGPITVQGPSPQWKDKVNDIAKAASTSSFDTANSELNSERNLDQRFQQFYHDRGYAAVRVTAARAGDATAGPDGIHVPYTVTIDEGKVYKLGSVQLPAGAPVTQPEVDKMLAARPGGPEDGVRLRGLSELIVNRYKAKGNLDCTVTPKPQFDDAAGIVNYTVDIAPGPVYHLAFVKFENVSDDLRALLIRNWQMLPGDPFDETYAANFITDVQGHDAVLRKSLANVIARFNATADQQTHDVNVVIRLEKR
ncbi:MAG TPA: hypothetical protein VE291_13865 [Terracidiphilus sp.]|jgi:outer membrane protein insertion porin family|nr:hypothetical protein [Terracidiphilus sp.]